MEEKKWLDEPRFLHALSYCMLLPGPEAQQLATYSGWLLHGIRGGLLAGLLFILPGVLAIGLLSLVYVQYRELEWVSAIFFGIKPAVAAIVFEAVLRLRRRALPSRSAGLLALSAFVAIFLFAVPFPLIVLGAALLGWLAYRLGLRAAPAAPAAPAPGPSLPRPPIGPALRTGLAWLALWLIPIGLLVLVLALGSGHILVREAVFFAKAAVVTFGGAYSVLAYVAQEATTSGWLSPGQMMDGLGLAEATPGPLIMVVQFVGFLGAYHAATEAPIAAGIAGALVTIWVTFAPCFLFIFTGAPYLEWLRGHRGLSAALGGVMAAVVGVVLNLAVWFLLHVPFGVVTRTPAGPLRVWIPDPASLDWAALAIALAALYAVFRLRLGMFAVLGGGALLGLAIQVFR